jgi:hypothetical protein
MITEPTSSNRLRLAALNVAVLIAGMIGLVLFIYVAAGLDTQAPREQVAAAFEDGTLSRDTYRLLEPVVGFIVAESDANGSCHMYSQMLAPADTVFGLGAWAGVDTTMCPNLDLAVHGEARYGVSYYRYWQGASAITKVALSVMSVFAWQILLTVILLLVMAFLVVRSWRLSRTFAVGLATTFFMTTDLLWQGMSPLHGVSSSVALVFCTVVLLAFERRWTVRWGLVALGGASYAMVAQLLVPVAFAILTSLLAALPLLRNGWNRSARGMLVAPTAGVLWALGYLLGLLSRYVWVVVFGPGFDTLRGELLGTGGGFITKSFRDPFYQVVGLLTKTWFGVGWMQAGLMVFFAILGWSLARGGARNFLSKPALVALSPSLLGVTWIAIWAGHTNHTFVHVLLAMMLLNVLFASETSRALTAMDTPPEAPDRSIDQESISDLRA